MEVCFYQKNYTLPDDVLVYFDLLKTTEEISKSMNRDFRNGNETDMLIYFDRFAYDVIRNNLSVFAKKLSEHGIYTRTVDEYISEEEINFLRQINQNRLSAYEVYAMEEQNNYQAEAQKAEQRAASTITGSGIMVFTSSLLTLAITQAVENNIVNKQTEQANIQYRNELSDISRRGTSTRKGKEGNYLYSTFYPQMEKAFRMIAFSAMGQYISDLIAVGKFDEAALQHTDATKSSNLLNNLKVVDNKQIVFENAFLACPYNVDVYVALTEYGNLDSQSFEIIKKFGLEIDFLKTVRLICRDMPRTESLAEDVRRRRNYYYAIEMCGGESVSRQISNFARPVYEDTIEPYKDMQRLLDRNYAQRYLSRIKEDVTKLSIYNVEPAVRKLLSKTNSEETYDTLVHVCGYTNLYREITPSNYEPFKSKQEADEFYKSKLTTVFTTLIDKTKTDALQKQLDELEKAEPQCPDITMVLTNPAVLIYVAYAFCVAILGAAQIFSSISLAFFIVPFVFVIFYVIIRLIQANAKWKEWYEQKREIEEEIKKIS